MLLEIDKNGITLHCNNFYISQYHEKIRRGRAATLRKFTEKRVRGKPCPYVQGLWCWNEERYGVSCMFTGLVLSNGEDCRCGYWGFHWADGSRKKPRDTWDLRKFWRFNGACKKDDCWCGLK